jgi:hypothetical protein
MRRSRVFSGVTVLMFGLLTLFRMLDNPRLAALHGADVVSLVAAGACFGASSFLLFGRNVKFKGD